MKGPGVRGLVGAVVASVVLSVGLGVAMATAASSARGLAEVPSQAPTTVPNAAAAGPVATELPTSTSASVIGDPDADRTIRRIVFTLLGLAAAVLLVTILFWRATRPVPVPLNRLSIMQSRAWRKADAAQRASMLGPTRSTTAGDAGGVVDASSEPVVAAPVVADVEPSPDGVAASQDAPAEEPSPDGVAASQDAPAEEPSGPSASLLADG
jgi:hypothetical protein